MFDGYTEGCPGRERSTGKPEPVVIQGAGAAQGFAAQQLQGTRAPEFCEQTREIAVAMGLAADPGHQQLRKLTSGRLQASLLKGWIAGKELEKLTRGQGCYDGRLHGGHCFAGAVAHQPAPTDGLTSEQTRQGEGPACRVVPNQTHGSFGDEHHLVGKSVGLQQWLTGAVSQPFQLGPLGGQKVLKRYRQGGDVFAHGRGMEQVDPGLGSPAWSDLMVSVSQRRYSR